MTFVKKKESLVRKIFSCCWLLLGKKGSCNVFSSVPPRRPGPLQFPWNGFSKRRSFIIILQCNGGRILTVTCSQMAYHRGEDQNINNAMQQNKTAHASWSVKKRWDMSSHPVLCHKSNFIVQRGGGCVVCEKEMHLKPNELLLQKIFFYYYLTLQFCTTSRIIELFQHDDVDDIKSTVDDVQI